MIKITLNNLIYIVPDLIDLFLSGFIFMVVYSWLINKKYDFSVMTVWSLFISYIIKSICSTIHIFLFTNVGFNDSSKILIYAGAGIAFAFFTVWLRKCKIIQKLLYSTNNKSINDDIFDDIIDYEKATMMKVYLKTNIYYIGKFCFREENGINSWIVLINYISLVKDSNKALYKSDIGDIKSVVTINLRDIERIELIYEDDSMVWERLSGVQYKNKQEITPPVKPKEVKLDINK